MPQSDASSASASDDPTWALDLVRRHCHGVSPLSMRHRITSTFTACNSSIKDELVYPMFEVATFVSRVTTSNGPKSERHVIRSLDLPVHMLGRAHRRAVPRYRRGSPERRFRVPPELSPERSPLSPGNVFTDPPVVCNDSSNRSLRPIRIDETFVIPDENFFPD